jgi:hypothetical protein
MPAAALNSACSSSGWLAAAPPEGDSSHVNLQQQQQQQQQERMRCVKYTFMSKLAFSAAGLLDMPALLSEIQPQSISQVALLVTLHCSTMH